MEKSWLNLQADKIDATLQEFGIAGRVCGGAILPQVVLFQLHLGPGQRLGEVQRLQEELALRLDVSRVLVSRQDGVVRVEIPRPDPVVLSMSDVLKGLGYTPPAQSALLGLAESGSPLLVYFPSPNVAHLLVTGITGSGKTELLRTVLVSLSLWSGRQAAVYVIDPKNERLAELARLPSVMQVCGAEMAPALLNLLLQEMERRGGREGRKHIYVVIDELADLVMVDRSVEAAITRLVQRGREVGIHVIAATQRASASVVAGLMKANFPVRACGAVNSRAEAAIGTGVAGSGAEALYGKGDMVVVHRGLVERFQVALVVDLESCPAGRFLEALSDKALPDHLGSVVDVTARLRERLKLRGRGRPEKGYTEEMVLFALGQFAAKGDCTQRALRDWHKTVYGADCNPPRAVAAIQEAARRYVAGLTGQANH